MKKLATLIIMALAITFATATIAYASEIRVQMAGRFVDFEGQQPAIIEGRTLVPVRGVFTLMGFEPTWQGHNNTAILENADTRIVIQVGSPTFTVNGRVIRPDVPAMNLNGRILIPLRAIVEAIDGDAIWDSANRIAIILPPAALDQIVADNVANMPGNNAGNNASPGHTGGTGNDGGGSGGTAPVQNVSITFRNNGGRGTIATMTFPLGNSQTLPQNTFTRDGYVFAGWGLSPTGEVAHAEGATLSPTSNLTLYAIWRVEPPVITTQGFEAGMARMSVRRRLEATGRRPITWAITAGALPEGLVLDPSNGNISGTPTPTAHGVFTFTATASNAGGSVSQELTLEIERNRWSSIELPNRRLTDAERTAWIADYRELGGATENELEVIRLVNIERANHGLVAVQMDEALMMAARFYGQQANDLRGLHTGSHNFGPYATDPAARHGASANVAAAFGGNLRWNGGNWFSGGSMTAEALVRGWMNSDGHRRYILSPEHRFIGAGQFPGGISYLFLSDRASSAVPSTPTTPAAQTRTITFRANGGSGTMPNQSIPNNTPTPLNPNAFTRANHIFLGWATTANGQVVYTDGANITATSNRTLHAVWQSTTVQTRTITFRANGGTGTMPNQNVPLNTPAPLNVNTFTRANYTFVGWATTANGQVVYTDGANITATSNRTLHAIWQADTAQTHNITFVANGGTGNMTAQAVPHNTATALHGNTFTRAGYTFAGWATSPHGQAVYVDRGNIIATAPRRLYATWQAAAAQTHNITFNPNGGTGNMPAQAVPHNTATALHANTFARVDHTFAGWATSATGQVVYADRANITATASRSLYAIWQAATPQGEPPHFTDTTIPAGTEGEAFTFTFQELGTGPITWAVTVGMLPPGLSMTGATLSGTPTEAGTFTFTLSKENTFGAVTRVFIIRIDPAAPEAEVERLVWQRAGTNDFLFRNPSPAQQPTFRVRLGEVLTIPVSTFIPHNYPSDSYVLWGAFSIAHNWREIGNVRIQRGDVTTQFVIDTSTMYFLTPGAYGFAFSIFNPSRFVTGQALDNAHISIVVYA